MATQLSFDAACHMPYSRIPGILPAPTSCCCPKTLPSSIFIWLASAHSPPSDLPQPRHHWPTNSTQPLPPNIHLQPRPPTPPPPVFPLPSLHSYPLPSLALLLDWFIRLLHLPSSFWVPSSSVWSFQLCPSYCWWLHANIIIKDYHLRVNLLSVQTPLIWVPSRR